MYQKDNHAKTTGVNIPLRNEKNENPISQSNKNIGWKILKYILITESYGSSSPKPKFHSLKV
jgi:hypothetical protein